MRKKPKVPVVRAWRRPDSPEFVRLRVGSHYYVRRGKMWESTTEYDHRKWTHRYGYRELPPAEARRLNQQRLKAMKGRRP